MTREPVITERPDSLPSVSIRVAAGCKDIFGEFYITISTDPKCFEIKLELGKSGSCQRAMLEAIQGLLTICRRQLNPIPRKLILRQLKGIRCQNDSAFLPSCPEAICRLLETEWGEEEKVERKEDVPTAP